VALKDPNLAKQYYEQSIKINPKHSSPVYRLSELNQGKPILNRYFPWDVLYFNK